MQQVHIFCVSPELTTLFIDEYWHCLFPKARRKTAFRSGFFLPRRRSRKRNNGSCKNVFGRIAGPRSDRTVITPARFACSGGLAPCRRPATGGAPGRRLAASAASTPAECPLHLGTPRRLRLAFLLHDLRHLLFSLFFTEPRISLSSQVCPLPNRYY